MSNAPAHRKKFEQFSDHAETGPILSREEIDVLPPRSETLASTKETFSGHIKPGRLRRSRNAHSGIPPVNELQQAGIVGSTSDAVPSAVTIVVPCYDERQSLPMLFERLVELECDLCNRYDVHVLFVDDGSTDGTWHAIREAAVDRSNWSVVRHDTNRGIAAAIMTGIGVAQTETVCSIDADCTYEPSQLAEMIPLLKSDVDLVTASPYHPDGTVNGGGWRVVLSKFCSRSYRAVLRNKLYTYTSCFRVYRRSAVSPLVLRASGFVGIAEMVVRLDTRGSKITEYPATLSVRTTGTSKLRVLPTALAHVKLLVSAICAKARAPVSSVTGTRRMSQHLVE